MAGRLHSLRWRLGATRRIWRAGASGAGGIPSSKFRRGAYGVLDEPISGEAIDRTALRVRGWVVFRSAPNARVEVWLGDRLLGTARVGVARPDVQGLSSTPHATASGFDLSADLSDWDEPDGQTFVRVVATSTEGKRHELPPVQVTVGSLETGRSMSEGLPPPAPTTPNPPARGDRRVAVFTHQLNLGGAQLYLLDLLREMVRQETAQPTVVSAMDGVLRRDLEQLGIPTHISGIPPLEDLSSHIGRVEEIAAWLSDRDSEVAFVNTATAFTFPGAEVASLLGIPTVWAIHESFPPAILWEALSPEIRERAEDALGNAAAAVFEAEATLRLFEAKVGGRSMVLPYGLDLGPIDAGRASFNRAAARRDAGIPEDADLVICVGTVEPRKAQLPLAQAFGMIAADHPRARLAFVGGRDDIDSQALADVIAASPAGDRIDLIPVTPDVESWYGMADLLVCASDIESLPRTVLEAMAWETPVLATEVFGLPELIDDGMTGWLCEPRDVNILAGALDRVLRTTPAERQEIARRARVLVEDRHNLPSYAEKVSELLTETITTATPPQRRMAPQ